MTVMFEFREVLRAASKKGELAKKQKLQLVRILLIPGNRRHFWNAAEEAVAQNYQDTTGRSFFTSGFNWRNLLGWMIEYLPQILSILLLLLPIFLGTKEKYALAEEIE